VDIAKWARVPADILEQLVGEVADATRRPDAI
jgi:hypothetical protein